MQVLLACCYVFISKVNSRLELTAGIKVVISYNN